ncbi:MAG: glutamine-hydrolyzing GMP synthase [Planctomycetes bacterium]|nr:glutamine-hydrolyzing GMP synthase [Planctomycetota bacterium]
MSIATIAVIDFGSQYTQLIARRVREHRTHSLIFAPSVTADDLRQHNIIGIILSGGPSSSYEDDAPVCHKSLIDMEVPLLGICYGMQAMVRALGGNVDAAVHREYGRTQLDIRHADQLLNHLPSPTTVWMSHGDRVDRVPDQFEVIASTKNCPIAAFRHKKRRIYGLQFHPEVSHTPHGTQITHNFLADVCEAPMDWVMGNVARDAIAKIKEQVADNERVICGLSGGVDSSVTAALLHEAIGDRLVCIFVDNGLLRKGELELVESTFREHFAIDLRVAHESERFLTALKGVTDSDRKRRIIGQLFIDVFREAASHIENARYLAQGTLYPDVIESGSGPHGASAGIKLHHNVGGLPKDLGFELIEPLRDLFKDEARRIGEHLDLPSDMVWRHPFPGPGLAVRIIGEVTLDRVRLLQDIDAITIEEVRAAGWYEKIGQAFAVLLPISTVGVMGDARSYHGQQVAAIRFVETTDFMTADWVRVDYSVLERISSRVMNEVRGVNRVVYDISGKPPATIEWE